MVDWLNLLSLIRQSDVLDSFNLLTVLYKLDATREIVHVCPAAIRKLYHRTYISRLFTFFIACHVFLFWSNMLPLCLAACCSNYLSLNSII